MSTTVILKHFLKVLKAHKTSDLQENHLKISPVPQDTQGWWQSQVLRDFQKIRRDGDDLTSGERIFPKVGTMAEKGHLLSLSSVVLWQTGLAACLSDWIRWDGQTYLGWSNPSNKLYMSDNPNVLPYKCCGILSAHVVPIDLDKSNQGKLMYIKITFEQSHI